MGGPRKRLGDSAGAFAAVFRNRNLRHLELAWAFSIIGHWAFLIAVSVYAYAQGGEEAVGLVFLLRLLPAAFVSPFAGLLADRYPRERVLLATELIRVVLVTAVAACVFADADEWIVYAFAIAATIAMTPFRSAQAALTPSLARTPAELTAANATASGVESLAVFVGPALGGLILAFASTGAAFVATALMLGASAFLILLLRVERRERRVGEIEASTLVSEAFAGFRTIWRHSSLRLMMVLLTAQTVVAGFAQVYIVVVAIDVLDLGEGGVGFLNSAIGVGALVGAVAALGLTGVRRLSPPFLAGSLAWGVPLIVVGIWPQTAVALVLFALLGLGNSISDVAGLTLVQRAVPDDVLARVFGVIQMLWLAAIGIGAALAPLAIDGIGVESSLIATGALMTGLVVVLWPWVARIDAAAPPPSPDELRILGTVPIFAPLPGSSLEHLAGRLVPLRLEPGAMIVREGDPGDRFYIVAEGTVEISEGGFPIGELEAGGYFGEIALLRDVPRTATVVARTLVVLYALDREDFLAAVTSHAPSAEAAEEVVSARLAGVPVAGARLPAG